MNPTALRISPLPPGIEPPAETYFFARQPILDRRQNIVAYELLYRSDSGQSTVSSLPHNATAQVVINAMNLTGLENLLENGAKAFINIDASMLLDEHIETIPKRCFVFELLETLEFTPQITERIAQLYEKGYVFALDDVVCSRESLSDLRGILPYVRYVKLDILLQKSDEMAPYMALFKKMGITVLAEKVETRKEYDAYHALGCDLFQGYFFARPDLVSGPRVAPHMSLVLYIIRLLNRNEFGEARAALKQDAGLAAQLLRYINSAAFSFRSDIKSLDQALAMLGERAFKQWLILISYALGSQAGMSSPLMRLAQERSNIMRLLAERCYDPKHGEDAAFIGLLSLLDVLFSKPLATLLQELRIDTELTDVLLGNATGPMGSIYGLAQSIESADVIALDLYMHALDLSFSELAAIVQQSYETCETFQRALHTYAIKP